jgi:hypothetical protein
MTETIQLSAPAPTAPHAEHEDTSGLDAAALANDDHLHQLFEQLANWYTSRRLFGSPKQPPSLLGRLGKRDRPLRTEAPDAACSAQMAALYMAYVAQPQGLDRRVFELHYFGRVRNIKNAASAVGVGRQHWYWLLRGFRRRVYSASVKIMVEEAERRAALPHSVATIT